MPKSLAAIKASVRRWVDDEIVGARVADDIRALVTEADRLLEELAAAKVVIREARALCEAPAPTTHDIDRLRQAGKAYEQGRTSHE